MKPERELKSKEYYNELKIYGKKLQIEFKANMGLAYEEYEESKLNYIYGR